MKKIRCINWNIGNPRIERLEKQIDYLIDTDSDILVLTESGLDDKNKIIEEKFAKMGYGAFYNSNYNDKYSTIILVREIYNPKLLMLDDLNYCSRTSIVELEINKKEITLIGTYFPANNRKKMEKKKKHADDLFQIIDRLKHKNIMLKGDFNSVKATHEPKFTWFRKWEYEIFDKLSENGLYDANCVLNSDLVSYSWYGNKNIGHLYDYTYVSEPLISFLMKVNFNRETIDLGLSDHSIQNIEMNL